MGDDASTFDPAQVVADHLESVYRYAFRLSGSAVDAEDLTQQVFLTAHQKQGQIRNAGSTRGWLFAILRHCFSKSCQKRRPTPAANLQLNVETIPADPPTGEAIDQEQLQLGIDQLPSPYRVVLAMFYFENCSYREIAEKLDLPIGTVMSRLARAKGHLRTYLFDSNRRTEAARPRSAAKPRG
jgi:RNA polymerase sigma-70 factor (ECF subfamily)